MTSHEAVLLILRTVLSLGIVLALALVLIRFGLPRLSAWRGVKDAGIEILGMRPLDRQHKVAVLRAEGRRFLVLFGAGAATLLGSSAEVGAAPLDDAVPGEES